MDKGTQSELQAMLAPWEGPYGGMPPLNRVNPALFVPAFEIALAEKRAEIGAIVGDPDTATFENTLAALEDSGRTLRRLECLYSVFTATMSDNVVRAAERQVATMLAAFEDEIAQNTGLFARIQAVRDSIDGSTLTAEQKRLVDVVSNRLRRRGAGLDAVTSARLAAINGQLAELNIEFAQNLLADESEACIELESDEDLEGLPDNLRAAAAAAARDRNLSRPYAIVNSRSMVDPFLALSRRRDLREKVWRMWRSRGQTDEHNNARLISGILTLRAERARLLGFASHAHWRTADMMAKSPERAMAMMREIWPRALAAAKVELADLQELARADGENHAIAPWDHAYYAQRLTKARLDFDESAIKPYLQLETLREAMFWVAGELYGLNFELIPEAPVHHPDVRAFAVIRNGQAIGQWWFDPYARVGKRSGAWMNELRSQERFRGEVRPIIANTCNCVRGDPGEPSLLSWDDATVMFHEFGHALHGLCADATYPTLAGVKVVKDFVELPSLLNEAWLSTDAVLRRFAVHYQTGEPMHGELIAKIKQFKEFHRGISTIEYLASAIYDMDIHLASTETNRLDPMQFEIETMARLEMPEAVVMRHGPGQFGHAFAVESYSAGYYSYLWCDALAADVVEAFEAAAGGMYDTEVARRFHDMVLCVGDTVPPDEAFRGFRGRDVDSAALLRTWGLDAHGR